MGQLESYTLQDIFLVSIVSGVLTTYFAEEMEATTESAVPYLYSANIKSKKRSKTVNDKVPTGDIIGAMHNTHNFLGISKTSFIVIEKSVDEKIMWQDPFLSKWEGSASRESLERLDEKHNWKNA
jgi:hypothetical protein